MWARLLRNAAVLLVATMGKAAIANEPGTEVVTSVNDSQVGPGKAVSAERVTNSAATGKLPSDHGRNPRVILITSKSSVNCRRELEKLSKPGGTFESMKSQGWKIGPSSSDHVQIVDQHDVPDLVRQLDSSEFPIVACVSDDEIVRSFKDGCSTPLDPWTFGWLLKGVSERPKAAIPESIRVATTGSYPLRGNHWSVDGDNNPTKAFLVSHLRTPQHSPYLDASWKLDDWSLEELRSLHDDLHEKYGPAGPAAGGPAASAGLPDGIRKGLGK